ncbi:permease prefix domain 1-containing protein [Anaerotignum sp.]
MNSSEQFKHYTDKVCEQIRWKKAHGIVAQEIENHLIDQKNAYMDMGDSESTAEEKALLQMGDPVAVGAALDGTHKPAPQWGMMGLVMVLFLIGAVIQFLFMKNMLLDTDFQSASLNTLVIFLPISLAVFFIAYFLDFSFFGKFPYAFPAALLITYIISHFFGLERFVGGYLYIQTGMFLGNFFISPATLSLIFPLAFCGLFYHLRNRGNKGFFLGGLAAVFFCLQLMFWRTASGLFLFLLSAGMLMVFAAKQNWFGNRAKHLLFLFILVAVIALVFIVVSDPYYHARFIDLTAKIHPETEPNGTGYLSLFLRDMLEHSVFIGKDTSIDLLSSYGDVFLTEFRSAYLLTYLTYQYGWTVSIGLVLLLTVFLVFGFRKCLKQKSILGQMISLSILCTFTAEVLIYIITNLGYPILAPISLPFLSYGINGMLFNMFLAGILLSVFRTGEVYRDSTKPVINESKFIQWDDGKLIISFK